MTPDNIIVAFKTRDRARNELNIPNSTFSQWMTQGIPYYTQCALYFENPRRLKKFKPSRDHAVPDWREVVERENSGRPDCLAG